MKVGKSINHQKTIKAPKPGRSRYHQGRFHPKHPKKYIGDVTKIYYRSGWELEFMQTLDKNSAVIQWSSEEIAIDYVNPFTQKRHRYYPDFLVKMKDKRGKIVMKLYEIKPKSQVARPINKLKKNGQPTKKSVEEYAKWRVNEAKWKAAKKWCSNKNIQFQILTEDELKK